MNISLIVTTLQSIIISLSFFSVGNLQRTNTGGQLDRGGMRRSISASRGGPGARIVKKSRTVQTQLTLDAGN